NRKDIDPLLWFHARNNDREKKPKHIKAHVEKRETSPARLPEENQLREAMAGALQPADKLDASGILLSQCRSELAEALDDLSAPPIQERWRPFGWLRRWMALRPAWSGVLLVLFGIVVGTQVVPWLQNTRNGDANNQAMNV